MISARTRSLSGLSVALVSAAILVTSHGWSQASLEENSALHWQSAARLRHTITKTSGTLVVDSLGIEFKSEKGAALRWPFQEVQTLSITPKSLVVKGYENRNWHLPGDREFRFDLAETIPTEVAAALTTVVGKPVRNADPNPQTPSLNEIPARHPKRMGGSNGVLRFRDAGIDYLTSSTGDGRSWRWADIETIANPDTYHFRVAGYLETYDFELKTPMARELFDQLWEKVYGKDLNIASGGTQ